MGTHLLVVGSAGQGAQLALRAPAAPAVAAALGLGDQVAVGGGHLAHGLQHLGEAEALAGVWAHRGTQMQGLRQCQHQGGEQEVPGLAWVG